MDTSLIKSELKALMLRDQSLQKVLKTNCISLDLDNSIADEEDPISIDKKLFHVIEECKGPMK